jgi:hypothetical protein
MEKGLLNYKIYALLLIALGFYSFNSFWGFEGHKVINNKAVYCLPSDLFPFYKANIDYITEHSIDPDKRRHSDKAEAPRHYIDIDYYAPEGEDPFLVMPRKWNDAVEKFTEDTLLEYGIVPWRVLQMSSWLTAAFKKGNKDEILRLSAELGHYVADACVPLHTTLNYDGQLSNQKGIHSFWETRLVEIYLADYDLLCERAEYIENQRDYIWTIVQESHENVILVLNAELEASQALDEDEKFIIVDNNGYEEMKPSLLYAEAFNRRLDGMVEYRMIQAIEAVSSFWYTAWVNAGQPDLNNLK